ncbi:hypothetical protein, partial [Methylorubrum thiocyanatum]|uniref:hypothetical protein n=1 Tax=Methylorubrum thiocyanatum TaxID=47958 RepID=UPI001AEEDF39
FPEIDRFRHNSRLDLFFAFLDRFPTPGSITTRTCTRARINTGYERGKQGAKSPSSGLTPEVERRQDC